MKRILICLAIIAAAPLVNAQFAYATYRCSATIGGTNTALTLTLFTGGNVSLMPDYSINDSGPGPQYGTFTEKNGLRTFNVDNATNRFSGKISNGVVSGSYVHYVTGAKGTFSYHPTQQ